MNIQNIDDSMMLPETHSGVQDLRMYGYAPGGYSGRCHTCKQEYIGDKRASTCRDCAEEAHRKDMPVCGIIVEPMSFNMRQALQIDANCPHTPTAMTTEYRLAVSGVGPAAYEWEDKPHRLVYDLCREIEALQILRDVAEEFLVVYKAGTADADHLAEQIMAALHGKKLGE